jgi:hypothetical protein
MYLNCLLFEFTEYSEIVKNKQFDISTNVHIDRKYEM